MRNILTQTLILCCWFGMVARSITAQTPTTPVQICLPAMLDVTGLPIPPSYTYGDHLFVLEFQNISPAPCSLQAEWVTLEPTSDTNNQPFYAALKPGDPGYQAELHPQVLQPGAWAHMLFMWTSRASPILYCDQYSGFRLGFSYPWEFQIKPGIEIRHLWIRACGPFGVSGYRLGKYSSASPIPQELVRSVLASTFARFHRSITHSIFGDCRSFAHALTQRTS